jgi:hypothetical protein
MAGNSKLVTHFKNPIFRKISYTLILAGIFITPVLIKIMPEELGAIIISGLMTFGVGVFFQWSGVGKVVYIAGDNEFKISRLFGGHTLFSFDKSFSKLKVVETSRYLKGLGEHRSFYHVALVVTRDEFIYYLGYRKSLNMPSSSSKSYHISTNLIFNNEEKASKSLAQQASKGMPCDYETLKIGKGQELLTFY